MLNRVLISLKLIKNQRILNLKIMKTITTLSGSRCGGTIKISIATAICCFIFGINNSSAQAAEKKTETFKVYGNCDMCKETMEGVLKKKDGVTKKSWSPKTKMITVTYDPSKITLTQIKQKIADVGYDTDEIQAKDAVYNNLHHCCQYDRAKK